MIRWYPYMLYIVASELNDPIWHSSEWQIGSFSSEATICWTSIFLVSAIHSTWKICNSRICLRCYLKLYVTSVYNAKFLLGPSVLPIWKIVRLKYIAWVGYICHFHCVNSACVRFVFSNGLALLLYILCEYISIISPNFVEIDWKEGSFCFFNLSEP